MVRRDILSARDHLNFSALGLQPAAAQKAKLYESVNMIQLGAMPLPQYAALHRAAEITPEEMAVLRNYLGPWKKHVGDGSDFSDEVEPFRADLSSVKPESNGLQFDSSFEDWKAISITERGDNGTLRVIVGNEIALDAARSGKVSPWPEGSRLAKIAWQESIGDDGLIHPGKFVQVEFMVKDSARYKQTSGWGWGRWCGSELKAYGADSHFVNECTGCHRPMQKDDFVYTLPITTAAAGSPELVNNSAAALPRSLPYPVLDWRVITMYVDPASLSMAILYGNDTAIGSMRSRQGSSGSKTSLPAGSVLALVTWSQREDPHWFGGRIPDHPKSIELVNSDAAGKLEYQRFGEASRDPRAGTGDVPAIRTRFITDLGPAWLP